MLFLIYFSGFDFFTMPSFFRSTHFQCCFLLLKYSIHAVQPEIVSCWPNVLFACLRPHPFHAPWMEFLNGRS